MAAISKDEFGELLNSFIAPTVSGLNPDNLKPDPSQSNLNEADKAKQHIAQLQGFMNQMFLCNVPEMPPKGFTYLDTDGVDGSKTQAAFKAMAKVLGYPHAGLNADGTLNPPELLEKMRSYAGSAAWDKGIVQVQSNLEQVVVRAGLVMGLGPNDRPVNAGEAANELAHFLNKHFEDAPRWKELPETEGIMSKDIDTAIRRYQAEKHLKPDGKVGPATYWAMVEEDWDEKQKGRLLPGDIEPIPLIAPPEKQAEIWKRLVGRGVAPEHIRFVTPRHSQERNATQEGLAFVDTPGEAVGIHSGLPGLSAAVDGIRQATGGALLKDTPNSELAAATIGPKSTRERG